ncbi:MAG: TonB-dependent receptor plug domain-containing protein [Pseudomonadota bacterium]
MAHRCSLALLLTFSAVSAAAQDSSLEYFSLSLDELLKVKVTSTSRNPELTRLAPGSVTVFTRAELDNMGIRTLTDLLNLVTGVQALFEPPEGRSNLLLGRGTPESYGQGFLLLLDGERLNEHYTGGFTLANRMVPVSNLARVEIIRGPGSALYGSNAFSGVINLISSDKSDRYAAGVGADGGYLLSASHNADAGDWHYGLFAEIAGDDGQRHDGVFDRFGLQQQTSDPRRARDGQFRLGFRDTLLTVRHSARELENFYVFGRLSDGINEEFTEQQFVRLEQQWGTAEQPIVLAYSRSRVRWEPFARITLGGEPPFEPAGLLNGAKLDYRAESLSLDVSQRYDFGQLNWGAHAEQADIPLASTITNYDPIDLSYFGELRELSADRYRFVEDRSRRLIGIYLQHQYQWSDAWSTTLGLRHDDYNDIGSRFTPRLAVIYAPGDIHTGKLLWGRAFRAPGLGDLYDRDAGSTVGNPNLDAIESETLELAYLQTRADWRGGLTLFDNQIENLLSAIALPSGDTLITNIGENHSQGVELELSYAPSPAWLLRLSSTAITRNRSKGIPDANAMLAEDYSPSRYGSLIVNWQHGDWNVNLNGYWRNAIPVIAHGEGEHLNLVTSYRLQADWLLRLRLDNLTDSEHTIPARGSALGVDENGNRMRDVPTRGRSWLLVLEWRPQ